MNALELYVYNLIDIINIAFPNILLIYIYIYQLQDVNRQTLHNQ